MIARFMFLYKPGVTLGGVESEKESEESGEVPGLSALFSTCTSTDAYSVVSVRDFLYLFIWN